ncbi:MAG: hypothetical protein OXF27_21100 [Acidobacteria bacterium]|nr:hypothetical protein [Acidobacteriota bacterium]
MAEANQIIFTYKEITTALLKQQGIHSGIWGIYVKFGIQGTNIGPSDDALVPAAILPLIEVGLQRFDKVNNLSVDAAVENPELSAVENPS